MNKMWKIYLSNQSFVDEAIGKMIEKYHVLVGTVMTIPIYEYNTNSFNNIIEVRVTNIVGRNYYMILTA